MAVSKGLRSVAIELAGRGADVNKLNEFKQSPLVNLLSKDKKLYLNQNQVVGMYSALIDLKTDVSLLDNKGNSAFSYAVKNYISIFEYNHIKIDSFMGNFKDFKIKPLMSKELLNKQNNEGDTPIHLLANMDLHYVINKNIIQANHNTIDFSKKNNIGETPLSILLRKMNKESSEFIFDNVDGINSYQDSLYGDKDKDLIKAIQLKIPKMFNHLLALGANPNTYEALHLAVVQKNTKTIDLLIYSGADINLKDRRGRPPVFNILSEDSGYVSLYKNLPSAVKVDILDAFLNKGYDINSVDNLGESLLFKAVAAKDEFLMNILLEKGANILLTNNNGESVLAKSIKENTSIRLIKFLVVLGSDVNQQDNNGETPLHKAFHLDNKAVIQILIDENADLKITNNNNFTPVDISLYMNDGNHYGIKEIEDKMSDVNRLER